MDARSKAPGKSVVSTSNERNLSSQPNENQSVFAQPKSSTISNLAHEVISATKDQVGPYFYNNQNSYGRYQVVSASQPIEA
jgi:hypothetical protein